MTALCIRRRRTSAHTKSHHAYMYATHLHRRARGRDTIYVHNDNPVSVEGIQTKQKRAEKKSRQKIPEPRNRLTDMSACLRACVCAAAVSNLLCRNQTLSSLLSFSMFFFFVSIYTYLSLMLNENQNRKYVFVDVSRRPHRNKDE